MNATMQRLLIESLMNYFAGIKKVPTENELIHRLNHEHMMGGYSDEERDYLESVIYSDRSRMDDELYRQIADNEVTGK